MTSTTDPVVVVGVDGSEGSMEALHWAADYVHRCGGRLQVIGAWRHPNVYYGYAAPMLGGDLEGDTGVMVRATVAKVLGEEPDVPVEVTVTEGPAAEVLVDATKSADLLVVGSRGHGAFTGMLLGSVGSHCAHQAHCPVVVVRS